MRIYCRSISRPLFWVSQPGCMLTYYCRTFWKMMRSREVGDHLLLSNRTMRRLIWPSNFHAGPSGSCWRRRAWLLMAAADSLYMLLVDGEARSVSLQGNGPNLTKPYPVKEQWPASQPCKPVKWLTDAFIRSWIAGKSLRCGRRLAGTIVELAWTAEGGMPRESLGIWNKATDFDSMCLSSFQSNSLCMTRPLQGHSPPQQFFPP